MFQYNFFSSHAPARSAESQTRLSATDRRDRLVLAWGEHCVECAAPACYATCDLYQPTETGKCRRIEHGIRPVSGSDGAELRFKRWGKLEAQGNTRLFAPNRAGRLERQVTGAARLAHRIGRLATRLTANPRWNKAPEALFRRLDRRLSRSQATGGRLPNLAVLVADNCQAATARLALTIAIDKTRLARPLPPSQLPPPCAIPVELPAGISHLQLPLTEAAALFASGLPFTIALIPLGEDMPHLIVHRLDIVHEPELTTPASVPSGTPSTPRSPSGAAAKLVVFDLDNTLWDGVLLEGEVVLRQGIAELFRELDERGVLLSVASKNAPDDALAKLAALGLDQFLLFPQVGWLPKSRSLQAIVDTINIGIDSVIFVDDNPFERAEVAAAHPQVEVLDDLALPGLARHPRLQGAKTEESRQRRRMYQETVQRSAAASGFGGDYLAFLKSSELVVTIRPDSPADHERIAELVQRTNQLNFSGRKYDRAAIAAALADDRIHLVIECADRFGSYGTVGFCMARITGDSAAPELIIDDFMLSCRVQGKFIEKALLHHLTSSMEPPPAAIVVNFHKTERNRPAQLVLEEIGFQPGKDGGYRLDPRDVDLSVPFMTLQRG